MGTYVFVLGSYFLVSSSLLITLIKCLSDRGGYRAVSATGWTVQKTYSSDKSLLDSQQKQEHSKSAEKKIGGKRNLVAVCAAAWISANCSFVA